MLPCLLPPFICLRLVLSVFSLSFPLHLFSHYPPSHYHLTISAKELLFIIQGPAQSPSVQSILYYFSLSSNLYKNIHSSHYYHLKQFMHIFNTCIVTNHFFFNVYYFSSVKVELDFHFFVHPVKLVLCEH